MENDNKSNFFKQGMSTLLHIFSIFSLWLGPSHLFNYVICLFIVSVTGSQVAHPSFYHIYVRGKVGLHD